MLKTPRQAQQGSDPFQQHIGSLPKQAISGKKTVPKGMLAGKKIREGRSSSLCLEKRFTAGQNCNQCLSGLGTPWGIGMEPSGHLGMGMR